MPNSTENDDTPGWIKGGLPGGAETSRPTQDASQPENVQTPDSDATPASEQSAAALAAVQTGATEPPAEQSETALIAPDAGPAPEQSEAAVSEPGAELQDGPPEPTRPGSEDAPALSTPPEMEAAAPDPVGDAAPAPGQFAEALIDVDAGEGETALEPEQSEAARIEPGAADSPADPPARAAVEPETQASGLTPEQLESAVAELQSSTKELVPDAEASNGAAPVEKSARSKKGWGPSPKAAVQSADAAVSNGGLSTEALIESLLFVADGAVTVGNLAEALEAPPREIEAALTTLAAGYVQRGLSLQRFKDKVQLTTAPAAAARVERFLGLAAATPLSRAALEALAIIAYQQPVTRPQIEAVRGVNSDSVIKNLLAKGLVEEQGRAEGPGRPVLYVTTTEFMQHFGLGSLSDLPPLTPPEQGGEPSAESILKG